MNKEVGLAAEDLCVLLNGGSLEGGSEENIVFKAQTLSLPFKKDVHAWNAEQI